MFLQLTGPTGWTRQLALSPLRHFTGAAISTPAAIDLHAVQALLDQVQKATGIPATGASVGIVMKVHVTGTVAGQPVDAELHAHRRASSFSRWSSRRAGARRPPPRVPHRAASPPLRPALTRARQGRVTTVSSVPNTFSLAGHVARYSTIAWLALVGFLLTGALAALLAVLLRRNQAFDEAARIRARYAHLLVPILIGEDLGWPPVDVTSFKALVRLAESAGQLVLHHQADAVDTYLVNDNGTVYRYQITLPLVSWGEWTETNVAADPAALADAATVLAEVGRSRLHEAAPTAG